MEGNILESAYIELDGGRVGAGRPGRSSGQAGGHFGDGRPAAAAEEVRRRRNAECGGPIGAPIRLAACTAVCTELGTEERERFGGRAGEISNKRGERDRESMDPTRPDPNRPETHSIF